MYVVAIAWIYVALLVALTQPSVMRSIVTFALAGVAPLALWLWLVGTPQRRRNRERDDRASGAREPDE